MKTIYAVLLMCFAGFAFADETGNFGGVPNAGNFEEKPLGTVQGPRAMGEEEVEDSDGAEAEEDGGDYEGHEAEEYDGDVAPT